MCTYVCVVMCLCQISSFCVGSSSYHSVVLRISGYNQQTHVRVCVRTYVDASVLSGRFCCWYSLAGGWVGMYVWVDLGWFKLEILH